MTNVISLRPALYEAKLFSAQTALGEFKAAGTLCGCVDFAMPKGTYTFTSDEVMSLIVMLKNAREDVLKNSDPYGDPRIVETKP